MLNKILKVNIPAKYLYVISVAVILLISGLLYVTYAMFTADISASSVINMSAGTTYEFQINGTQNFEVAPNNTAAFNVSITNSKNESIYYEIYYTSSDSLANVVVSEVVEDTSLTTAPNTSGVISANGNKKVPIMIQNNGGSVVNVTIGVVSGIVGNEIVYGKNGYPNGTKITTIYDINNITNDCFASTDSNCETEINVYNQNTEGSLEEVTEEVYVCNSTTKENNFIVNAPDIIDGMIPIVYIGNSWVKADSSNSNQSWYNYEQKQWANVALVKTISAANTKLSDGTLCTGTNGYCTREDYMNAKTHTTIPEADVLAYYVWIPRYKYQLFNVEFAAIDPIEIQVEFESGDATTGIPSETPANGEWLTHPAFTFGEEEIRGFWIGKFETTGSTTTPTIKPNVAPLVSQTGSAFLTANKKFVSETYLTSSGILQVDAHMPRNMNWGALAYLKQSKYGLGLTDIAMNNYYNSGCRTGCSTGSTSQTTTCNAYNTSSGVNSSTTGNVYGVYDTSGIVRTFVVATIETSAGGALTYSSSGFNATTLPYESKYVDMYAYGTTGDTQADYNRSKLGDALGETRGWYSDIQLFVDSSNPWFYRGGLYSGAAAAGIFAFVDNTGAANASYGSRSILTKLSN